MLIAFAASADEGSSLRSQERPRNDRIHAQARALRTSTLGVHATEGQGSYDLVLAGDFYLGGEIFQSGYLFTHTRGIGTALGRGALDSLTTGLFNTAFGWQALSANTTGTGNTGIGDYALLANQDGHDNTAIGRYTLQANVSGEGNTAVGHRALEQNSGADLGPGLASGNTAVGSAALLHNTTGYRNTALGVGSLREGEITSKNTAVGYAALRFHVGPEPDGFGGNTAVGYAALVTSTTGYRNTAVGGKTLQVIGAGAHNVAIGYEAGKYIEGGTGNIMINSVGAVGDEHTLRIGNGSGTNRRNLDKVFIHGIFNRTVDSASDVQVLIDDDGKLGTIASARRYKDEIRDMAERSAPLHELRPVTFRYRNDGDGEGDPERPLRYGLIAEEVAEVFPELVVYNDAGQPETVKYHLLSAMLLNEVQRLRRRIDALEGRDRNESGTARGAP